MCRYICEGWQEVNNCEDLKPYWSRQLELSIHNGCVLWGGSGGSFKGESFHAGRVPYLAPTNMTDESAGKRCGLVVWFGWYGGSCGEGCLENQ